MIHYILDVVLFYDLRNQLRYQDLQGRRIEEVELVKFFPALGKVDLSIKSGSEEWYNLISKLVFCLSGKEIEARQLHIYRQLARQIDKQFTSISVSDKNIALAYFIVMFAVKKEVWSHSDKNSYHDATSFLEVIASSTQVQTYSVFCAHRESNEVAKDTLVSKLKLVAFQRLVNAYCGFLFHLGKRSKWILYHPSGNNFGLISIFPGIALQYMQQDKEKELCKIMDKHFDKVDLYCQRLSSRVLTLELRDLSQFIEPIIYNLTIRYGEDWVKFDRYDLFSEEHEDILLLARDLALTDVRRYMPELEKNHGDLGLNMFYRHYGLMDPVAKSIYESNFYSHWGEIVKNNQAIGLGIDRDHDLFQVQGFHYGNQGKIEFGSRAPLLYARRSGRENGENNINAISLRQFWRWSDTKR